MDSLRGLTGIFLGVVGLGVAGQIVLGDKVGFDVIGNLQRYRRRIRWRRCKALLV